MLSVHWTSYGLNVRGHSSFFQTPVNEKSNRENPPQPRRYTYSPLGFSNKMDSYCQRWWDHKKQSHNQRYIFPHQSRKVPMTRLPFFLLQVSVLWVWSRNWSTCSVLLSKRLSTLFIYYTFSQKGGRKSNEPKSQTTLFLFGRDRKLLIA